MGERAQAILWAQFRSLRNYLPRSSKAGAAVAVLVSAIWYGFFLFLAVAAFIFFSTTADPQARRGALSAGLLTAFFYWQVFPLILASTGASLDMRKLLAYPVPPRDLFFLEVLLRISTGIEVLILLLGTGLGLLFNRAVPKWAPLALLLFAVFNLLLAAGVREVLGGLMKRKRFREVAVLLFVLLAATPQLLVREAAAGHGHRFATGFAWPFWPWNATAALAAGVAGLTSLTALLLWTAAAYRFGRWQFERGLLTDVSEPAVAPSSSTSAAGRWRESLVTLPAALFADPLASMLEKELRSLLRTPRFRLVFIMGFTFGLLIWLPMSFANPSPDSFLARNYLTLIYLYSLMLLSDALFWNTLGFDRTAAQLYFVVPVRFGLVLLAKNITAAVFVTLELLIITVVCAALRFPVTLNRILEAVAICGVVMLILLAVGNITTVRDPRPVNPGRSLRPSSGVLTRMLLLFLFPLALAPAVLAYLARYAFCNQLAFYGVMVFALAFAFVVYRVGTESALRTAAEGKEQVLIALARTIGPIS